MGFSTEMLIESEIYEGIVTDGRLGQQFPQPEHKALVPYISDQSVDIQWKPTYGEHNDHNR